MWKQLTGTTGSKVDCSFVCKSEKQNVNLKELKMFHESRGEPQCPLISLSGFIINCMRVSSAVHMAGVAVWFIHYIHYPVVPGWLYPHRRQCPILRANPVGPQVPEWPRDTGGHPQHPGSRSGTHKLYNSTWFFLMGCGTELVLYYCSATKIG